MLANANTKYMCTFTHTYCEEYMHKHAHLVFTLYVKYLQFLIFIQCTKMLHELKIHYKKKHIKQCTSLAPNSIEIQLFGLSKIFMHTIKLSMQIKENPL